MWIRTQTGAVLNSKYLHGFRVSDAAGARSYPHRGATVTHLDAPKSGHVVLAWSGRETYWLTDGVAEAQATDILQMLVEALESGQVVFDVGEHRPMP